MGVQGRVPKTGCSMRSAGCPQLPGMLGTNLRMMFFRVQMLGSVWNECFESPCNVLHRIFRVFGSFPTILFVWSLLFIYCF